MKKFLSVLSVLLVLSLASAPLALAGRTLPATTTTRQTLIQQGELAADGTITATATAGAATLNKTLGVITSEALTTAGLAAYTLTITDSTVSATSIVQASLANGTNTQGTPAIGRITPGAGSVVIVVYNLHATQALNGTLVVSFNVVK